MNNFYEALKHYFSITPNSKVQEQWQNTKEFDEIGPTIEEFMEFTPKYHIVTTSSQMNQFQEEFNKFSPKSTSGFLFNNNFKYNAESSFFNR